jgi:hypothetical protein
MALNPGDFAIIAFLSDANAGAGGGETLIRIIATTDIPAGESIKIFESGSGTADFIEYIVGSSGLNALDIVTFTESGDTVTVEGDADGVASVSSQGTITPGIEFSTTAASDIAIVSDGEVIWGIDFDNTFQSDHSSTTDADAFNTGPPVPNPIVIIENPEGTAPSGPGVDDNWVFTGSDLTQLDDPGAYTATDTAQDYDNVSIGGVTFGASAASDTQASITCFMPGTQIATPRGACAVQSLRIGDEILTSDHRTVAVKWIGRQTVEKARIAERSEPVRISAGALGNGLPESNLYVTAYHGILIDGYVINAGALVNDRTIYFIPQMVLAPRFTVYHVETEDHDIILANGAPAETYADCVTRSGFDNYQDYLELYGVERIIPELPYPRISSARLLPEPIRARLGLLPNAENRDQFVA